jgi:hypothetical protein
VVIDATPHLLRNGPRAPEIVRQWPELLRPAEALDLARTARDPALFGRLSAAALLPSLRERHEIRGLALAALRGEAASRRYTAAQYWRNIRVNRGAMVMPPIPFRGDLAEVCRGLYPAFGCDPVSAAYLERFLALATSRGIPVFWVVPPVTTEVQDLLDCSGFDAAHTRFLESLQARHPGLVVLDGRRSRYGQDLHTDDPVHLNRRGASAFSADLAAALDRHLAEGRGPRWVTLPPYRDRPADVPLEDVNESALALKGTKRRN